MIFLRPPWRTRLIWFAVLIAAFITGALVYGYVKYKPILDARLQEHPHTNAVYSRPFGVAVGQKLSPRQLIAEMNEVGYRTRKNRFEPYWYEVAGKTVNIHHPAGKDQEEVFSITFEGNRVSRISEGDSMIREVRLRPQFLSNLLGKAREKRRYLRYDQFPKRLVEAVIAAEDANFFKHHGLDLPSLIRAATVNVTRMKRVQGGSTITQQFIKNYFLTPEKSFKRKIEEAYLAVLVESRFTKEQIFEFYANEVYMGQVGSFAIVGLPQAAESYFGKDLNDLSLSECALLAGMIQAPNRYSPLTDRAAADKRREYVLARMTATGLIKPDDARRAGAEKIETSSMRPLSTEAPYFVDFLSEVLNREIPAWRESESIYVYSTVDPELQQAAQQAVSKGMTRIDRRMGRRGDKQKAEAALIAVDPRTGDILAMVGGRNYRKSQFNRATRALRQPGSSFKPFVFAAALGSNVSPPITLATVVLDAPYTIRFNDEDYQPTNFGGGYRGNVTLRRALALSLNVPTVKLAEQIGYQSVVSFSKRLGFSEDLKAFPSMALGTWEVTLTEMAQAYTAFANQGNVTRLRTVTDYYQNGQHHEVPVRSTPVLTPQVTYLITSALESATRWGTGAGIRGEGFSLPAAGKTGSSNDSWFIGYTPDMLCAVWVGNDDFTDIGMIGSEAALPIWVNFMKEANAMGRLAGASFPVPENITTRTICPDSGLLATWSCPGPQNEYFITGTPPTGSCYLSHWDEGFEIEEDRQDTVLTGENPTTDEGTSGEAKKKKRGFWDWIRGSSE